MATIKLLRGRQVVKTPASYAGNSWVRIPPPQLGSYSKIHNKAPILLQNGSTPSVYRERFPKKLPTYWKVSSYVAERWVEAPYG